jgi:hypothetical protein
VRLTLSNFEFARTVNNEPDVHSWIWQIWEIGGTRQVGDEGGDSGLPNGRLRSLPQAAVCDIPPVRTGARVLSPGVSLFLIVVLAGV